MRQGQAELDHPLAHHRQPLSGCPDRGVEETRLVAQRP